jgi:hypothetical protein
MNRRQERRAAAIAQDLEDRKTARRIFLAMGGNPEQCDAVQVAVRDDGRTPLLWYWEDVNEVHTPIENPTRTEADRMDSFTSQLLNPPAWIYVHS